jgi:hypothetical protein
MFESFLIDLGGLQLYKTVGILLLNLCPGGSLTSDSGDMGPQTFRER